MKFIVNVDEVPEEVEADSLNEAVEIVHQHIDIHEMDKEMERVLRRIKE